MQEETRNLILTVVLCSAVIFAYQYFVDRPQTEAQRAQQAAQQAAQQQTQGQTAAPGSAQAPSPTAAPGATNATANSPATKPRAEVIAQSQRVKFDTARLRGSISLTGGLLDDVSLVKYHETVDPKSPDITLLSPPGSAKSYYADFGWVAAAGTNATVPTQDTVWHTDDATMAPGRPVTLTWDNGAGLTFEKTYTIDDNYMLTVTQKVTNNTGSPVALAPYGLISRLGTPKTLGYAILHEGPVAVMDGSLQEKNYKDLVKKGEIKMDSTGGWLGITDKYWLVALIPDQKAQIAGRFSHSMSGGTDRYQADYLRSTVTVPAGQSTAITDRVFAGAKEVSVVDGYYDKLGIDRFDLVIDWGYFRFITRPLFFILDYFFKLTGNFGIAILLLTVSVKIALFWFANKQYEGMSRMRKLQPKMQELRERFKDDKEKMQLETMNLYKQEKVNPLGGCWPLFIQMPIFFALYKVLFITIEMRQAPFFGWIKDLSVPDPMYVTTLFGLIPWDPPSFLAIGIWPVLMGATMFLSQKLNPQMPDPVQARIFMLMPLFMVFIFARLPAGLVIYYTWNNILTVSQQWVIMKRQGAI
jgi:YidC/Oxa1 family membrane protein insertase